ncbi:MAG: single-stranded-DNA-specific exonuclease RecJ, partial [Acidobacteria bacterium]
GPRINASGRMDSAETALKLLLCPDKQEAEALARTVDSYNRQRQKVEAQIVAEANDLISRQVNFKEHKVIVVAKQGWHAGCLGIVASRLAERFYRPAVMITVNEDGKCRGSGRSIRNFHLFAGLDHCRELLDGFGGHRHAAGVTIERARLEAFRAAFEAHAAAHLGDDDLVPRCKIDGWLEERDVTERTAEDLARLGPFGAGHPEPVFALRGAAARARTVGAGNAHLKLAFGRGIDAIGFGMGDRLAACAGPVEAAFTLGFDAWDGARRLQLKLRDVRPSTVPVSAVVAPVAG